MEPSAPCPTPGAVPEPPTPSLRVMGFRGGDDRPSGGATTPVQKHARHSCPPSPLSRLLREASVPSLPSLGLSISTKGCRLGGVGLRTPASARGGGGSGANSATGAGGVSGFSHRLRSLSACDLSCDLLSRSSEPIGIPLYRRTSDGLRADAAMLEELSSVESGRWGAGAVPSTPCGPPPRGFGWTTAPPASPAVGSLRAMKMAVEGQAAARLLDQLAAAEADRAALRSDCAALLAAARSGACVGGQLFDSEEEDRPATDGPPSPASSGGGDRSGAASPPLPSKAAAPAHPLGSVGDDLAGLASPGARCLAVAF